MRAAAALALLGFAGSGLAQQPPPAAEGWDGRLPPAPIQAQQPAPQQLPPQGYASGYGAPVFILPPLRYGRTLCPDRAPP